MESGKKTIGVVALVAAMVMLQLAIAPTAMARSLQGMKTDELLRAFEVGMGVNMYYCAGTCVVSPCSGTSADCRCQWPSCVA
ncbi:hypothetical protein CFC21_038585 [Triticum aestivum]|uniref:Uncharacterized protein n=3 Tax=Triticum TaxID=4564 RepID=A0A9R0S1V5_TRITD|nr:hypothetical protein CFC21_038585 [Triticum aestivum]VAH70189.1 unnamed protein product [Triticum turgidum subsp. durum]